MTDNCWGLAKASYKPIVILTNEYKKFFLELKTVMLGHCHIIRCNINDKTDSYRIM